MVAATDFPEPWNVIAVWSVAIPTVALLTNRITDLGIQNFTILKARLACLRRRRLPHTDRRMCRRSERRAACPAPVRSETELRSRGHVP